MTAPNHVTGGIVITGIFCSLWNLNIFENPIYISTVIIGSLLPDIDHTKSIIGKAVYPLAKWISRSYGHRTITHSIFFLVLITTIAYTIEFLTATNHNITMILFFAVFSHLLLDMVTVQGIPLLYPFYKNPCVIPANVDLRINTGNLKQEGIVLFIFAFLTIFLQDLFSQGFWFSYNKQFNDITHVYREFKKTPQLLSIKYDYNLFQKRYKNEGYLLYADNKQCYIVGDTLTHLVKGTQGLKINKLIPERTKQVLSIHKKNFSSIPIDSLNTILHKKFIAEGLIFSNSKINVLDQNNLKTDIHFELKNQYNIKFTPFLNDTNNTETSKNINELEYLIKIEEDALNDSNSKYYKAKKEIRILRKKLKTEISNYEINEIKNKLIQLEAFVSGFTPKKSKTILKLKQQLKDLKTKSITTEPYISGFVKYFKIPKK